MNQPCERCPCPAQCIRRPSFCRWAAEEPPDPVRMRHICDRSAMGNAPAYPSVARQALNLAGAAGRAITAAVTGEPVMVPVEVLEQRKAICSGCPDWGAPARRCRRCGCRTDAKLRGAQEECPAGKWGRWERP